MLLLFTILIAFAASFTLLFLLIYPGDADNFRKNLRGMARPLILLVMATAFWSMSLPAFTSKDVVTTQFPSYVITSNVVGGSNTVITVQAYNVLTYDNYPLQGTFYNYFYLWLGIMALHFVLFIIFYLNWMADTADLG